MTPLNGPMLLWAMMIAVGILVSAYPQKTLPKATNLILGLAVWRVMACLPTADGRATRLSAASLALMGAGVVALGLVNTNWSSKIPALEPILARLPSQLAALPEAPDAGVSPNQLGGTLALLLPCALSALVGAIVTRPDQQRRGLRGARLAGLLLGTGCSATLGAALVLTQSRSAWIGAASGTLALPLLWGLTSKSRCWRRASLILATVALLGAAAAGAIAGAERLTAWWDTATTAEMETSLAGSVSLSGRVEIWSRALYAIQDFAFTGCGLGTFREVVWLLYPLFTIPPSDIAHAHNIFLQVALDSGVPGLIAYLALLGVAGAMAWRVARSRPTERPLALGLLAGLVALHIYGLADALAPGSKPALIFWAMLGLLTALHRLATLAPTYESATLSATQTQSWRLP